MRFILILIGIMFALDALFWAASARIARPAGARIAVAIFSLAQLAGLIWLLTRRFSHAESDCRVPEVCNDGRIYLAHDHSASAPFAGSCAWLPILAATALIRISSTPPSSPIDANRCERWISRRQFLGVALAAAPPLLDLGLATIAMRQLRQFRVRRFVLPIAGLPSDLHGFTIAQVSDMHVGRFTSGRVLREMVRVVNGLRADLVLLTGDLINDALADLADGLALVRSMESRSAFT